MTSVVHEIGKLNLEGNTIPSSWFEHITLKSGKADMNAIVLLSEVVFFYSPIEGRDEATGKPVFRRRFALDKWQASYQGLADKFGLTKRQVASALKRLKDAGLITIELRTITTDAGIKVPNVTFIEPVPEAIEAITFNTRDNKLPAVTCNVCNPLHAYGEA
jgi:DNA-binding transcriptional ArsR family regulator